MGADLFEGAFNDGRESSPKVKAQGAQDESRAFLALLPAELDLLRGHAGVKQQSRFQELWGEDGSRLPRHN